MMKIKCYILPLRQHRNFISLRKTIDGTIHCCKVPVVIVGAGMAGLGAAKMLTEAGISTFVVLEAQDYVGGRVCSSKTHFLNHSTYFELGAQWIHGENNPVFELANSEGLLSKDVSTEGEGMFLKPNGELIPDIIVHEVAKVIGDILEDCCKFVDDIDYDDPGSIGDILLKRFSKYLENCNDLPHIRKMKEDLYGWHKRFQIIDNSCDDLSCLSAKSWGLYQCNGGNNYNNFKAGYLSLVESLINGFVKDSIKTSSEVKHINFDSNKNEIKVFCEDGTVYLTEHVIVTCSVGYLKENHQSLFSPLLPVNMIRAIQSIGFGTINKLFLMYNNNWWPEGIKGIQLVWDCEEEEDADHQSWLRHISGFDVVDNMTGVLLGWIGGEGARIMETLTDAEISNECTKIIRRFLNRPLIPFPLKIVRSNWHSNKFVRGAYSHMTKDCDKEGNGSENLSQPIYVNNPSNPKDKHPAILFAGEAVHKHYYSTTHGAYLSGRTQAQIIIDYRNKNNN